MNKNYTLLLLIIIIAAGLRLVNIGSLPPGLYPDEAMNGSNAQEALQSGEFKVFYPENNGREGLFINIQAVFIAALGNQPWVVRLPSTIFGTLTVLALYLLMKELFKNNRIAPLLGALFLATNFWHINFSRIGFRAIMAPFFLTLALYCLLKLRQSRHKLLGAIIGGAIYGLGFYSYIAYRATPIILFVAFIYLWFQTKNLVERKTFYQSISVFILTAGIVVVPLALYFLHNPADFFGRADQVSIFSSSMPVYDLTINIFKTLGMFFVTGDSNWRHNIAGAPQLFWPVSCLLLIGCVRIVQSLLNKTAVWPAVLLLGWFVAAAIPVVVSNEGLPHALRAILLIPPVIMLAAYGGDFLYNRMVSQFGHTVINASMFVFATLLVVSAWHSYFIVWGTQPAVAQAFTNDYVHLADEINRLPATTPKVIIVNVSGVDVRGIPMPAQTVMFLTDSFTLAGRAKKNIHYITPDQLDTFQQPTGAVLRWLSI